MQPTIRQLSVSLINNNPGSGYAVIGLGEDNKPYRWLNGQWEIAS
jgi:hypothetical protein